jgi:uncharacterized protein with PIN domain
MLGKLARELRLLGIDVEYERNLAGMAAYRVARQRGRILLSRANRLRELEGVLFVNAAAVEDQVAQVKAALESGLKPPVPVEVPGPETAAEPDEAESARPAEPPTTELPAASQRAGLVPVLPGSETPGVEKAGEPAPESGRPEPRRHEQRRPEPRPRREDEPKPTPAFGRCLDCNVPLENLSREAARPLVPFFVYQIHYEFRRCPKCRKVFWPGSHVTDMEKRARPAPQQRHQGPRRRRPDSRRHGPNQ